MRLGELDDAHTANAPVFAPALIKGAEILNLLAAFRDEARALRRAAEALATEPGTS